jgi:uncharacterized protein (DUF58 family)
MISREILARIKKIEIRTRRMVEELTAGAYHSVFKGSGIEFEDVREYTSDDDVRDIDWNVTAKMGDPYVKKYIEERELNVMLLVDASASNRFGSGQKTKMETALEIASVLAFSAIRNNDKVGLLLFSDKTELYLPPKSGKQHTLRLIRELLVRKPEGKNTNIAGALDKIMKILKKKAVVFLISDFIDDKHNYEKLLMVANKRHDVIGVRILDEKELEIPKIGSLYLSDSESGDIGYFYGNSNSVDQYNEFSREGHQKHKEICNKAKVDLIDIKCDDDLIKPLMSFFRRREKMVN